MWLKRLPVGAWLLGLPGLACLVLLVSGVTLVGSAAFPLVLAELAVRDGER